MPEKLSPETQKSQAQEFTNTLLSHGLPQKFQAQATRFARFLLSNNPPEGFLNRFADNFTFFNEERLNELLDNMAIQLQTLLDQNPQQPYYLLEIDVHRSGRWIYEQMLQRGVKPAAGFFIANASPEEENTYHDSSLLPQHARKIILDDWSISGAQVTDILMKLSSTQKADVLLLTATKAAREDIQRNPKCATFQTIIPQEHDIKKIANIFTRDDFHFLHRLEYQVLDCEYTSGPNSVLTASIHKIPDNFLTIAIESSPFYSRRSRKSPLLFGEIISPYHRIA